MTKKILLGIAMATIVLALGIGTQSFALAMTDNTQGDVAKNVSSPTFASSTDSMMLVATSPTAKGGKATFALVPRPAEGVDGIPVPRQAASDMILVATSNGGHISYVLVPKPVEGIDGIPLPKPIQQNSETTVSSPKSTDPSPMMLVAISPTKKGGSTTFMLVPKPVENVDGIPMQKQTSPDMILVAQPSPNGGKPIFTWIPKPVEGIDGIPLTKSPPNS
ncbi:MAG: hypothetical protein KGI08_07255 [Thaumarchaeota archaeon]|nr:hypothetical protein [Nitrososphaerota archaeon]